MIADCLIAIEQHMMRLTFKSKNVHLDTLLKHVLERGYPNREPEFRNADGHEPRNRAISFDLNGVQNHSDVYVFSNKRPGVYLIPDCIAMPRVHISLNPVPEIKVASVYPWTKVEAVGQREKVEWDLCVNNEGDPVSLVNQDTYYGHPSWELAINAPSKSSDQAAPSSLFRRLLNPRTSVVMSRSDVFISKYSIYSSYLSEVLERQLKLPYQMARDFEKYFEKYRTRLPRESAGDQLHIAISFVSQKTLDEIAPLRITPEPVATRRVFMLCGAVNTRRCHGTWAAWYKTWSSCKKAMQSKNWGEIVGLNREALSDQAGFRAIEWGVLQVPEEFLVSET